MPVIRKRGLRREEWSDNAKKILVSGTDKWGADDVDWPDFELVEILDRHEHWPGAAALEIAKEIWDQHKDEIEQICPHVICWGRLVFDEGRHPYEVLGGIFKRDVGKPICSNGTRYPFLEK